MHNKHKTPPKDSFYNLYPELSNEELLDAEERLRHYLLLAIDVLDQLAAVSDGEAVDNHG